jgi:hypothetical protein
MKPLLGAAVLMAMATPAFAAESDDAAKIRGFSGNEMLPTAKHWLTTIKPPPRCKGFTASHSEWQRGCIVLPR